MLERTLSIIKPDGVKTHRLGRIIARLEESGLQVKALTMHQLTKENAMGFYQVYKDKPFYDRLTDFMSEGPVVVMVLEGENAIALLRQVMGKTNPQEADPGTIRREFAESIERNVIHGSDSLTSAAYEISYFFSALEIMP